jgi:hypothetical protein
MSENGVLPLLLVVVLLLVLVLVLVLGCFGDFENEEDALIAEFSDRL